MLLESSAEYTFMNTITINNIVYQLPAVPVVGICMDGTSEPYYDAAREVMPNFQRLREKGSYGLVKTIIPSFTNPNNMGIVTGVTPDQNGISGNYYFNTETGEEVSMNTPEDLTCATIFEGFAGAGKKVAAVTAKGKLSRMLSKNWKGVCFSGEFADEADLRAEGINSVVNDLMGRPQPGIYDPDLSVYVIEAGVRLLRRQSFDLVYLTTTDYVQHRYRPEDATAIDFMAKVDHWFGELDRMGVVLGITADHGMEPKTEPDGSPKVRYLESLLGEQGMPSRVILPIADPYVAHHGSLGGYAMIHLEKEHIEKAGTFLATVPGVELVLSRAEACEQFKLSPAKVGDLVVLADRETVLGRYPEWHDLGVVKEGLRSHGSLHEQIVPMLVNRPLKPDYAELLASGEARNFQLFDFLCNGVA